MFDHQCHVLMKKIHKVHRMNAINEIICDV